MLAASPLITTLVAGVSAACLLGFAAKRAKLPALLGYLLAGVLLGPFTPGLHADSGIAGELAEVGIILLMFGVGIHFSVDDLWRVRRVVVPGALLGIVVMTGLGTLTGTLFGGTLVQAIILGVCVAVASTVVLLRNLESAQLTDAPLGKTAIGWLVVEDIVMVLALVLLPLLGEFAQGGDQQPSLLQVAREVGVVLLKIAAFAALMLVAGKRLLPPLLVKIAKTRSRELTSLATLSIALGFAYAAYTLFGASFALGAFLAGLVLNESEIGHKAAEHSLPLRDTFAVLFFVSVGMLFDPSILLREPLQVAGVLALIVLGKGGVAYLATTLLKQPAKMRLGMAASLAQIGEFSFILAGAARTQNLLTGDLYDLVLAGAILSIALNPFLFKLATRA